MADKSRFASKTLVGGVHYVELPNDVGTNATWTWNSGSYFEASASIISGLNIIGFYVYILNGTAIAQARISTNGEKVLIYGVVSPGMTPMTDAYRFKIYAIVKD